MQATFEGAQAEVQMGRKVRYVEETGKRGQWLDAQSFKNLTPDEQKHMFWEVNAEDMVPQDEPKQPEL